MHDIAVIGGGAAGIMAVLRGVLNNDSVVLFPGNAKDKKRGRAMWVRKIENMPGYHHYKRGIEDPNRDTLKWINESEFSENLTTMKGTSIKKINKVSDYHFDLTDDKGNVTSAKQVILATGVMDIQPHIDGSIQPILPFANHQTADYCIRCDGHHVLGKETVIIGDSDTAVWIAVLLHERYSPPNITVLTDTKKIEMSDDLKKLARLYHIDIIEKGIEVVQGDSKKGTLEGFSFCDGTILPADIAFISLGMMVYNELAKDLGVELDDRGFVVTNDKGESSLEGLFVAGDLRANAKKQIYTAWDHAVDSADAINNRLRRLKRQELLASKS